MVLGLVIGLLGCTEGARQAPAPEELPEPSAAPTRSGVAPGVANGASRARPTGLPGVATPASGAHPTGPPRSCALKLSSRDAHGNMAVSMELQNRTSEPLVAPYHHPLIFALQVWAGSQRLDVQIPPYDGPVEPRTITVPPGQRVTIPTPVTLRFAPDGKPKTSSPFEWLIVSAPRDVWLRARQVFTDMPDLSCDLKAHFR